MQKGKANFNNPLGQFKIMKILASIALLLLLIFFSVYFLNKNPSNQEVGEENKLEIFTDKESYKQGEEIKINVSFFSSQDLLNVEIKVSGIKTRYGDYLSLDKIANLKKGENIIEFSSRAPYCSACTGVSPGEHEITSKVIYNDTVLASASKTIRIES